MTDPFPHVPDPNFATPVAADRSAAAGGVTESLGLIRRRYALRPKLGLILGSGLGGCAEAVDVECELKYADLPGLPAPRAPGHHGQLLLGRWNGLPVAVLKGRCHLYEGWSAADIGRPVALLAALGVESLLTTCAAGGLNEQLRVGDILLVTDHLDLQFSHSRLPPSGASRIPPDGANQFGRGAVGTEPYCLRLQALLRESAAAAGVALPGGIYAAVRGPNFETRAEIRFLKRFADAVGMSLIPEVQAARRCGLRVAALAAITNLCRGAQTPPPSAEHVLSAAAGAAPTLREIVREFVSRLE